MAAADDLTIFGSEKRPWSESDWTASDDRVRGGKSQSYLKCSSDGARFYGTLDISTLGGPGFASQRTTGDDRLWNLHEYAGIQLNIAKGDKKRYTFILKDELLPPNKDNGREQATISYECDFDLPPESEPGDTEDKSVFIPWKSFNATYRGKVKKDAEPLNTKKIKRMSFMTRGFFGAQEGDFSLTITSVRALKEVPSKGYVAQPAMDAWQVERGHGSQGDARHMRISLQSSLIKFGFSIHRGLAMVLLTGLAMLSYVSFVMWQRH